jgi:hypothetical protein
MVELTLPTRLSADFLSLIPDHRTFINGLIDDNVICSYNINTERSKGWILFNAESEVEVMNHVQQFPIFSFIDFYINEIMIHDGMLERFPKLHFN